VSKHWTPPSHSAVLKGSRIRRDPARVSKIRRDPVQLERKKVERRTDEEEMFFGVLGVLLIAVAVVALILGAAIFTIFKVADNGPPAGHFGQCYNENGPNCVMDGDTVYVAGERVEIAGMDAPEVLDSRCAGERSRGIAAAVAMADLLSSGPVTVSRPFRDEFGRDVRIVQVKGKDVGKAMIRDGFAQRAGKPDKWCG